MQDGKEYKRAGTRRSAERTEREKGYTATAGVEHQNEALAAAVQSQDVPNLRLGEENVSRHRVAV